MADTFDMPGGPAFPISIPGVGDNGCPGMSLRDYFAANAMQRMVGSATSDPGNTTGLQTSIARISYEMADAMLEARKK
jgi:hypothetical protein